MARDHSGPYKNDLKEKLNIEIDNCKKSLNDDIEAGFKIIHIDTPLVTKQI